MVRLVNILLVLSSLAIPASAGAELAVVPNDAWFHRNPAPNAPRFQPDDGDGWITVEKIGSKKGWTRVRSNHLGAEKRCYGSLWQLNKISLEAWVRTDALAQVTVRRVKSKFRDGTSVHLNAGVVVVPRKKAGWYTAVTGEYSWPARLPEDAVGTTFQPTEMFEHSGGSFLVAEENLIVAGLPLPKTRGRGFWIRRQVEIDGILSHRLGWSCVEAMVHGEFREAGEGVGGMGMIGALSGGSDGHWHVPKGTPVYWDGDKAGSVHYASSIHDGREADDQICFDRAMNSGELTLCVDRDQVEWKKNDVLKSLGALSGTKATSGIALAQKKGVDRSGGISPTVAHRIIDQREPQVRECYDEALEESSGLEGKVELRLTVDESGAVAKTKITGSTLNHEPTHRCIVGVMNGLIFPAVEGREAADIEKTFDFAAD